MVADTARQLWDARINSTVLPREFDRLPRTEEDAYRIQAEMINLAGKEVIGWKVGASAAALFEFLGVTQPFLGPLFADFTYQSGHELQISPGSGLETEFTLRMKSDLPPRQTPYSIDEVESAVDSVIPSFEVVGSRFEGEPAGAGFLLIADGGANVATILGAEVTNWSELDLTNHTVRLSINDEEVKVGDPSILIWKHLFESASWVACHPALADRGLRAGDLVMSGTCTGLVPLSRGDTAMADFGAIGTVAATFN